MREIEIQTLRGAKNKCKKLYKCNPNTENNEYGNFFKDNNKTKQKWLSWDKLNEYWLDLITD